MSVCGSDGPPTFVPDCNIAKTIGWIALEAYRCLCINMWKCRGSIWISPNTYENHLVESSHLWLTAHHTFPRMHACLRACVCARILEWPSSSAHADRFIGYNNQSVFHPAVFCTCSSCNGLLHLESTINIRQLYTLTFRLFARNAPGLDSDPQDMLL